MSPKPERIVQAPRRPIFMSLAVPIIALLLGIQ
jgi:hypothetical protein